jgi:hypothetical protein
VKKFKEENNANPTDSDVSPISMELAEYNQIYEKYLQVKLEMLKQESLPFQTEDFIEPEVTALARRGTLRAGPSGNDSML